MGLIAGVCPCTGDILDWDDGIYNDGSGRADAGVVGEKN
jgi:hypothetical protein